MDNTLGLFDKYDKPVVDNTGEELVVDNTDSFQSHGYSKAPRMGVSRGLSKICY